VSDIREMVAAALLSRRELSEDQRKYLVTGCATIIVDEIWRTASSREQGGSVREDAEDGLEELFHGMRLVLKGKAMLS